MTVNDNKNHPVKVLIQVLDGIFLDKNSHLYPVYNNAVYFVIPDTY